MGAVFGGGGGGGGPAPDTTTQFIREAPGIEERKLELMDLARSTAQTPISIPDIQVQQLSPLEQAAITQSGQTGVGAGAVGQAITGTQAAMQAPNISQFYNPYQSYVLDEINRQSAMRQNQLAGQSVMAGAFGGGRQGIQAAEQERARLGQIGQAQAVGFQSALGAAQQQQAAERAGAAQLGTLGQVQQQMAGTDIQRQLQAGGLQRQIAQAQLDAARQTQLQRSAEPLQRLEFLSNIYAAGPKSTSGITAATLPQSSPLAQSIGTGLGVAQAYQGIQNPAAQTALAKAATGGLIEAANYRVKKYKVGGEVSDDGDESSDLLRDEYTGAVPQYLSESQRMNLMLRPLTAKLLQAKRMPGQSDASAAASAFGAGLEDQQTAALQLAKYDAAVAAAKEKAKKGSGTGSFFTSLTGAQLGIGDKEDEYFGEVTIGPKGNLIPVGQMQQKYDVSKEVGNIRKAFTDAKTFEIEGALDSLENLLQKAAAKGEGGDLPGVGPIGGSLIATPFISKRGKDLRSALAKFSNINLRKRSGAAVTQSELDRFMDEMAGGKTGISEKSLITAIGRARQELEKEKQYILNTFEGTKALDSFLSKEGIQLKESPSFIRGVMGATSDTSPFVEGRKVLTINGERILKIGNTFLRMDPKTGKYRPYKPPKNKSKGK